MSSASHPLVLQTQNCQVLFQKAVSHIMCSLSVWACAHWGQWQSFYWLQPFRIRPQAQRIGALLIPWCWPAKGACKCTSHQWMPSSQHLLHPKHMHSTATQVFSSLHEVQSLPRLHSWHSYLWIKASLISDRGCAELIRPSTIPAYFCREQR